MITTATWSDRALCAEPGADPEIFVPQPPSRLPEQARRICARCPVRRQCDDQAWSDKPPMGIHAGIPPAGRKGKTPHRRCSCGLLAVRSDGVCYACYPMHAF